MGTHTDFSIPKEKCIDWLYSCCMANWTIKFLFFWFFIIAWNNNSLVSFSFLWTAINLYCSRSTPNIKVRFSSWPQFKRAFRDKFTENPIKDAFDIFKASPRSYSSKISFTGHTPDYIHKCTDSSFSHFILLKSTKHGILSYNSTFLKIISKWAFMLTSFIIFIIKLTSMIRSNNLDFFNVLFFYFCFIKFKHVYCTCFVSD